jgi:hypothetical protein
MQTLLTLRVVYMVTTEFCVVSQVLRSQLAS